MVDQKLLREFGVFLFVFLCMESQRHLSEGSTSVTIVHQSATSSSTTCVSQSDTNSSTTCVSQSSSSSPSASASSSSSCFCYYTTAGFSSSSSTSFSVSPTSTSSASAATTSTSPASSSSASAVTTSIAPASTSSANELVCVCSTPWSSSFSSSSSTSLSASPTSTSSNSATPTSTSPPSTSAGNTSATSAAPSSTSAGSTTTTSVSSTTTTSASPSSTSAGSTTTTSTSSTTTTLASPSSTSAGSTTTTSTSSTTTTLASASSTSAGSTTTTSTSSTTTTLASPSSTSAGSTTTTSTSSTTTTLASPSSTSAGSTTTTSTSSTTTTLASPSSTSAGSTTTTSTSSTTTTLASPSSTSAGSTTTTSTSSTTTTLASPSSTSAGSTTTTSVAPSSTSAGSTTTTSTSSTTTTLASASSTSAGNSTTTLASPSSTSAGSTSTTSTSSTTTTPSAPSSTSAGSTSATSASAGSTSAGSTTTTSAAPSNSVSVFVSTSTPMSQSVESSVNVSSSSTPATDSSSVLSVQTDSIQPTTTSSMPLTSSVAADPCSSVVCQNDGTCKNSNGTGVCICAPGFNGSDCGQDIDECASSPCENNGTCVDGRNSFNCTCPVGYVGDTCSFEDPCLRNPCLNNGTCYVDAPNNYTFFCVCPIPKAYTGKDCGTPVPCFWDIMYPYGKEQGDQEIVAADVKKGFCPGVTINSGLYFFDNQFYEVYICANGMLAFEGQYFLNTPIPTYKTDEFPFHLAMLTPFWSKIDSELSFCSSPGDCYFNYANRSSVFYQVYTDTSQTQKVTYVLGNASEQVRSSQPEGFRNFSAKWVMVVTWLRLRPDDPFLEEGITNTFQVVLITNGTYTFVKYHYPCGAIEWSAPAIFEGEFRDDYEDYPVAGYNAGDGNHDDPDTRYPSLDGSGSYSVKDLDDKVGNTGRQGDYFFRVEQRKGDDASTMCNAWHDWQERELKSELDSAANQLPACPCIAFQITGRFKFDRTLIESECFISVNGITIDKTVTGGRVTADVHRTCCYFGDIGALNFFYSFLKVIYSARPDNVIIDSLAEQLCLEESNSPDSLDKFYNVRPINFCFGFVKDLIQKVILWGDPHVKTLDGTNYTFNGVGEYTLLKTDNNTFVLQARTEVAAQGGRNIATVFTVGVAKEADTDTVEIRLKSGGGLEMYINGTLYAGYNSLTNVSKEIGGNLRAAKKTASCVEVFFKSGVGVEFCEAKGMMSFVVSVVPEYFNITKGLLGTYNKDPGDEFTLPNGTALSSTLTSKQIHYDFGLNWQITAEQSLFTYGPNENVSTFMNKSFVPMFVEDIVWADNSTMQAAKQQCGNEVVCLFDAASTNDVSVGVNSKNVSIKLIEENKKLSNFPPKFTYVPSCIVVTLGEVAFVNVTASDNNYFTFNVLNKPDGANFTVSGNQLNFTWNVTSSKRVKFSFLVTDELGASAVSTPCIKLCACRNGGQCVAPKLGDKYNNDSKFIYQGCACSAGWTGRFCENDINACVLNGQPCFKGVKCTDQPAPANISGYTCGACPSGYSGNGIKCVDNNECGNSSLNNCAQNCTNTPGSFVCSCQPGFKLNSNKYDCDDINECVPTNDCMHQCNNTAGSYTCYCNDFFIVEPNDSKNCTPTDPCSGNNGCNQVCYKGYKGTGDTMACDCYSGYKLGSDSKTCEDIDECKIPGVKCTQRCENSIGGYKCKCFSAGYKLESDGFTCTDINECLDSKLFSCPGAFRVCENTPGNYTCKCQDGLFFINGTCKALKVGQTPPEPTIPSPRSPSKQETLNSVELRLTNMKEDQYNATVDQNFKQKIAQTTDDYCSQERAACAITSKRRRRALGIFTADHVHLLPGFPREENNFLRVVFYVLLPSVIQGGGVIPVATLLQVVNNSKSDLEALFGVSIAEIKLGVMTTTPPPSTQNNTSATTQGPTQSSTVGTVGEDSNDDWKWIVIGVVIGVVVIVCVIIVVCVVIKKKKQGKVEITNDGPGMPNNAWVNDENANRGYGNHEMVTHHGALPGEPLV